MGKNTTNCYEFYVDGMHCAACEMLIENRLKKDKNISRVKANLSSHKVIIEGNFNENPKEIANELTRLVEKDGYKVLAEKSEKNNVNWNDFIYALPIGIGIIVLFIILQKLGIVNLVNSSNGKLEYPIIFLIGIIASLSSCMAVVGGLVLSMAATYAKESKSEKNISQISFHLSRIISFFILGGILGLLGSTFKMSSILYFTLDIFIALVMIILAINMMDIIPFFKKLQPHMPKFISSKISVLDSENEKTVNLFEKATIIPAVLVGAATFFLPCGFTQSMQFYALGTGSFIDGALVMSIFALGTFPVLGLVSFTSITLAKSKSKGIFFKTAGIVVLFFALINILGALAIEGIIPPLLNF